VTEEKTIKHFQKGKEPEAQSILGLIKTDSLREELAQKIGQKKLFFSQIEFFEVNNKEYCN
jgi:hypothetical protein